ncbi:MAG: bifunctional diaminohydroxyphosphoribosylaminopyrimidine deaminase/5-amino-6-(5-phosphoribosylamino)uracil reductase RibD [Pyramidobacter sp.]|nr:bifunctional diaminohydroxyphosphoribosylaminopyrimidine deaminase/5-amino-6-(5-phosphoribosylamino)uracil reductase RibD [Pyramidobacter sp.]
MRQQWIDECFMHQALSLALRGMGKTSPNPMVGCVIVKDGKVVGRGWHDHVGGPHAEVGAMREAGDLCRGATAYVTLEPCSHQGRTPPCAPALAAAQISRCVAAIRDPNPKVSGRGLDILRQAGVEVECGVLAGEAVHLNRGFLSLQTRRRPWITIKAAVSLDGDMALLSGESQWITGEDARAVGHMLRSENDAVLVGANTLVNDDPSLTVRHTDGLQPRPVVLCGDLRRLDGNFKALTERTIVFTSEGQTVPSNCPAQIIAVPADRGGRLDLEHVVQKLGELGIARLLVESGGTLCSSFIRQGLADECHLFIAPLLMGQGIKMSGDILLDSMKQALPFAFNEVRRVGKDIWVEGGLPCSLDWLKQLER